MVYVAGALLVIVVLMVLSVGPVGVRKLAFVSLSCFGFVFWYISQRDHDPIAALRNTNGRIIEATKLRVERLTLVPIAYGGYELDGKVLNNSSVELNGIDFDVSLHDCSSINACRVVGQRTVSVRLAVAPGEAKEFKSEPIAFLNLPLAAAQGRTSNVKLVSAFAEAAE